ncbi:unnamed protein product [Protopolystoma xenopodis]|uniref:Uncharacterized protein n=1 Tax=Protopolystoma xenopodis TaxID=117903 RepID=A0A448X5B4_9PLAT|nr:unnamed protein product [Protopolystoma xenopodis]
MCAGPPASAAGFVDRPAPPGATGTGASVGPTHARHSCSRKAHQYTRTRTQTHTRARTHTSWWLHYSSTRLLSILARLVRPGTDWLRVVAPGQNGHTRVQLGLSLVSWPALCHSACTRPTCQQTDTCIQTATSHRIVWLGGPGSWVSRPGTHGRSHVRLRAGTQ